MQNVVMLYFFFCYVGGCTKPLSTIQCNKTLGQDKLVYTTHRLNALAAPPGINSGVTVISRQRAE